MSMSGASARMFRAVFNRLWVCASLEVLPARNGSKVGTPKLHAWLMPTSRGADMSRMDRNQHNAGSTNCIKALDLHCTMHRL